MPRSAADDANALLDVNRTLGDVILHLKIARGTLRKLTNGSDGNSIRSHRTYGLAKSIRKSLKRAKRLKRDRKLIR